MARRALPYGHLRYWLLPLLRARLRSVTGLENLPHSGGFLLAANHNAWLDTPLIGGAVYQHISKILYFISSSRYYQSLGAMPIDKNNRAAVVERAHQKLLAGHGVVVYPEGKSNPSTTLRYPHTGVGRLAHLTGLPVIPTGIRGTFGVPMPASVGCFFSFRPIIIEFGAPLQFPRLPTEQLTKEQLDATDWKILQAIAPLAGKQLPTT